MYGRVASYLHSGVVREHHQVGVVVAGFTEALRSGLQPHARGKRGHHQDTVVLLAVADPLWHLPEHNSINYIDTYKWLRDDYMIIVLNLFLICILILAANFTPGQGLQMKTSLLANSGIFTALFINMHCPWQINWINK